MKFAHFKRVDVFLCVKVVQFKQQSRLEEKRKKALDLQLDFIVGQTEKYSDLLSKSLAHARPLETTVSPQKSLPPPVDEDGKKRFLTISVEMILSVNTLERFQTWFNGSDSCHTSAPMTECSYMYAVVKSFIETKGCSSLSRSLLLWLLSKFCEIPQTPVSRLLILKWV